MPAPETKSPALLATGTGPKKVEQMNEIVRRASERNSVDDPATREFLLAALRSARLRVLVLANEIDAVGVAISRNMVPLGTAYEWLDDINAWPFLAPELARAAA